MFSPPPSTPSIALILSMLQDKLIGSHDTQDILFLHYADDLGAEFFNKSPIRMIHSSFDFTIFWYANKISAALCPKRMTSKDAVLKVRLFKVLVSISAIHLTTMISQVNWYLGIDGLSSKTPFKYHLTK